MFHFQGTLYKQVWSDENLTEAWKKVRSNSHVAGVDEITLSAFERNLFANLKVIQESLKVRTYHPQPVKRFHVRKADGNKRPLGILTVQDRIVQRAVLHVIQPIFDEGFEEWSYAFRPSRSVQMAIDHVLRFVNQGSPWIVDLDLLSFFESINLKRLFTLICARLKDRDLRRLIHAWLDIETFTVERRGLFRRPLARGILQGGVLSPLLANIYLDPFDKMALDRGLKVVRYGDDIVILCNTRLQANRHLKRARTMLAKLDLELNPRKTQIVHVEKGMTYLGERLFLKRYGDEERVVTVNGHHAQKAKEAAQPEAAVEASHSA